MRSRLKLLFVAGGVLLLTAGFFAVPEPAGAKQNFLDEFVTKYPHTAGTRLKSCTLCHHPTNFAPASMNPYGKDFQTICCALPLNFTGIENHDPDGDGWTNLQEIKSLFFPGDPADVPAYGVTLTSSATVRSGASGAAVAYALTVGNTGNTTDTFDVTLTGDTWITAASAASLSIAAGASANLTVTVSIPTSANDGDTDAVVVRVTSRGDPRPTRASAALTLTTTARTGPVGGVGWGERNSSTSQGKVLFVGDAGGGSDVLFYDGTQVVVVQRKDAAAAPGNIDSIVFGLGSGVPPGRVIGAWRRGTDFAWVWVNDGSLPKLVTAANPFNPDLTMPLQGMNPEALAIADGCVLMRLRAPVGNSEANHVFRLDLATGVATSLTGTDPVFGAARVKASGCQGAWVFDDGTGTLTLHFYDGATVRVVDSGNIGDADLDLRRGRIVYAKPVGGIRQIFLYDSTAPNPAPVQLTQETDPTKVNVRPRTDGRHAAWLRGDADATFQKAVLNADVVLNGGLRLTGEGTRPADPRFNDEHPLQLQRGQLIWKDRTSALRYHDGNRIRTVEIGPATSFSLPWLADGFVAYLSDIGAFVYEGTPPADALQPSPPLLVVATPGNGQVAVAWDGILGASGYNLYLAQQPGLTKDNYLSLAGGTKISGVTSPHTVTGLTNDRTYYFVVTAVEGDVEGPSSREAAATMVGGLSWAPVGGLAALRFSAVAADKANASVAYAGGSGSGFNCGNTPKPTGCDVYKTTDGGLTWTPVTGALSRTDVRALAVHGGNVFAATRDFFGVPSRLLRSPDGGSSWEEVVPDGGEIGEQRKSLAIDPIAPGTVYAGNFRLPAMNEAAGDSFLIQSTDAGASLTWAHLPDPAQPPGAEIRAYAIALDSLTFGTLYAGGTGTPNLVKSTDGGHTWSNIGIPLLGIGKNYVYALAVDPVNTDTLYVGTSGDGVYKSANGGRTWTQKNTGLPSPLPTINALLVDPGNPAYLHAGTEAGYFYSTDGGESWVAGHTGLTVDGKFINALAMTAGRHLIAATDDGLFLLDLAPVLPPVTLTLTVTRAGTGSGTVTSNPAGIDCGADCSEAYALGTVVMLTATPAAGSVFAGWSGEGCSGTGTCTVTMTQARSVTATFNLAGTLGLTLATNATAFRAGDSLVVSVGLDNSGVAATVDFYFGAVLPDGDTVVFFTDLAFNSGVGSLASPATLRPIVAGVDLAAPFVFSDPSFFTYPWVGTEPAGSYVLFLAAVAPGALADNRVDPGDIVALATAAVIFAP